jgi:ElaB/YqjD/DUF883 family membrane-anchored ribosome-binding protein
METVTKDKVLEDIRTVGNDAKELMKGMANDSGERLTNASSRAQASLRDAYASLVEAGNELGNHTRTAARATDRYVRDKPWHMLGVAAGVGLMVGYLLGRR